MRRYRPERKPENISSAVRSQRLERGKEVLDDFPTPPWATRAFVEYVLIPFWPFGEQVCWEPACGRGYMAKALFEYFGEVHSSDIVDYGVGALRHDFLTGDYPFEDPPHWIITNPPFNRAEAFIHKGLSIATVGVAVFTRLAFIESIGRYERLYSVTPPHIIAPYVERPLLLQGRLSRTGSTATAYMWSVWLKEKSLTRSKFPRAQIWKTPDGQYLRPRVVWIPPCRETYEYDRDYE